MSTRCTITVRDERGGRDAFSLYRHSDGYPDTQHGVVATLSKALPLAWSMPRFEADDFAAAIVAAWKDGGGYIRLTGGRDWHVDTEYHYEVFPDAGAVRVQVYGRANHGDWERMGEPKLVKAPAKRRVRNMCGGGS